MNAIERELTRQVAEASARDTYGPRCDDVWRALAGAGYWVLVSLAGHGRHARVSRAGGGPAIDVATQKCAAHSDIAQSTTTLVVTSPEATVQAVAAELERLERLDHQARRRAKAGPRPRATKTGGR